MPGRGRSGFAVSNPWSCICACTETNIWLLGRSSRETQVRAHPPGPRQGRPLGRWGTFPSFLPSAPEIPRDPSNRPPTNVTYKTGTQRAAYSELRAWDWNSPGIRRGDRNRAHAHKMVPHRTVLKVRGPRLSRQVKADLRYGRGCLSPHIWFSDLKTLPPHTPLTKGRAIPGLAIRSVSALRHRAPRDLSGDRPRGTGRLSHLFSVAGTSHAGISLRSPLHTSISRHSDWGRTSHTSTLPSSAAERSPAEAFAHRRMRSSPPAERRRPGPVTADEPTVQNPPLPQVPASLDSRSCLCAYVKSFSRRNCFDVLTQVTTWQSVG
jgi:hypothetical protein